MNRKEPAGGKKERKEVTIKKILGEKETRIILRRILEEGEVEIKELVQELKEKTKTKRATAYKKIKNWEENGLLEIKEEEGRKEKKVKISYGLKGLMKELNIRIEETQDIIKKIEKKTGKQKNEWGGNKLPQDTEKIAGKERANKGSMVTRIREEKKSTNSKILQRKRMDRNRRKRKTKTTTNKVSERWKKLRKGKIEEKYTKKQKKILSGIL